MDKSFAKRLLGISEEDERAANSYVNGGMIPWSRGFSEYKERELLRILEDADLMKTFVAGGSLPNGFGYRLDERIVEYPFVFAHLDPGDGLILDAGSTLNKPKLLDWRGLRDRRILIYTLETDWITLDPRISYLFADLRDMLLRSEIASSVVCISTLEHVGFSYEYQNYSQSNPDPHAAPETFVEALKEIHRVLEPGGQLLLTVPFGRYENHGWFQQFDADHVQRAIDAFGGSVADEAYYRYLPDGWQAATPLECAELEYFNVHAANGFDPDYAAAARAVVCLNLRK